MEFTEFTDVLLAIHEETIDYGRDRAYLLALDEGGYIRLLYRNRSIISIDEDGEKIDRWPVNASDGIPYFEEFIGKQALEIIGILLEQLSIDFLDV